MWLEAEAPHPRGVQRVGEGWWWTRRRCGRAGWRSEREDEEVGSVVYEGWLSRGVGGRRGASLASSAVRRRDAPRAVATHTGGGTTYKSHFLPSRRVSSRSIVVVSILVLVHTSLYRGTTGHHRSLSVSEKFCVLLLPPGCYPGVHLSSSGEGERERETKREWEKGRRTKRRSEKEWEGERRESKDGAILHKKRRKVGRGEASKREGKKGIEKSMSKREEDVGCILN